MRATGTFTVRDFTPASVAPEPPIRVALDVSVAPYVTGATGSVGLSSKWMRIGPLNR